MSRDIFDQMKQTPVVYEKGTFYGEPSRKRLSRAPFTLVVMPAITDGEQSLFAQPLNIGGIDLQYLSKTAVNEDMEMSLTGLGNEFGDRVIVGEHELGSFSNDDWRGVHAFSYL